MKKVILLVLLACTTSIAIAQRFQKINPFKVEQMENFKRSYFLRLDNGNRMRLDMYGADATTTQVNFDSLVAKMVASVALIRDSLGSATLTRTVTVSLYDTVATTISWNTREPATKTLAYYEDKTRFLKSIQDTIILNLYLFMPTTIEETPYVRLSFFLNNITDLRKYIDRKFNPVLQKLQPDKNILWGISPSGSKYLLSDPDVEMLRAYNPAKKNRGFIAAVSWNIQSYRNYFTTGMHFQIGIATDQHNIREECSVGYELNYSFSPGGAPHRNGFVTFSYHTERSFTNINDPIGVYPNLTLGYMIRSRGTVYDPNTFKIGLAKVFIANKKISLDPLLYFNNFFQDITPGIRMDLRL